MGKAVASACFYLGVRSAWTKLLLRCDVPERMSTCQNPRGISVTAVTFQSLSQRKKRRKYWPERPRTRNLCIGRTYSAYSGARSFPCSSLDKVRETQNAKFVRSRSPRRMANFMDRCRGGDGHYADVECANAELERYLVLSCNE